VDGNQSAPGGDGGAGVVPAGQPGLDNDSAGGGGGAVGRVRLNATTTPTVDGLVSPAESTGAFTLGSLPIVGG